VAPLSILEHPKTTLSTVASTVKSNNQETGVEPAVNARDLAC
jgi:hypothetical protein